MNPGKTHGAFSWSELMTPDPAAAAAFYNKVFGWSSEVSEMPTGQYTVASVGGRPVAGMMDPGDPNVPTAWTFYVTVDDVDACLAKAKELGATIAFEPMDIPEVGRFFGFIDPQGAYVAAIKYRYPEMPEGEAPNFQEAFGTHGAFSWFELRVPDVDAAMAFYKELFGWTFETVDMPVGPYPLIKVGGAGIGGIVSPPGEQEIPPHWGAYVTVDDADAIADAVSAAGGTVTVPPMDIPNVGRFVMFADGKGASLAAIKYVPMNE